MKLTTLLLTVGLAVTSLYVQSATPNLDNIDPDKARAYRAYLMTFIWPNNMSTEDVEYDHVLAVDNIPQFSNGSNSSNSPLTEDSPFSQFQKTFSARTHILTSNQWTLIFPDKGTSISETFHSDTLNQGYSEFTGSVRFTLGRYLESKLEYQHYLFNSYAEDDLSSPSYTLVISDDSMDTENATLMPMQSFGPTEVLKLSLTNKTASKKLNYLDHPIIGTLLYFEPIELEQAIEQSAP